MAALAPSGEPLAAGHRVSSCGSGSARPGPAVPAAPAAARAAGLGAGPAAALLPRRAESPPPGQGGGSRAPAGTGGGAAPVVFRERSGWRGQGAGCALPPSRAERSGEGVAPEPRAAHRPSGAPAPRLVPGPRTVGLSRRAEDREQRSAPGGPSPGGRTPRPAGPCASCGAPPASGARWPRGRPSPGSSSASGRCWPAGSPQVRAAAGRGTWGFAGRQWEEGEPETEIPGARRPVVAAAEAAAARAGAGREFPARSSAPAAERSFPAPGRGRDAGTRTGKLEDGAHVRGESVVVTRRANSRSGFTCWAGAQKWRFCVPRAPLPAGG